MQKTVNQNKSFYGKTIIVGGLLKWEEKNNQVQLTIANYDNFILLTQLKFLFHLCLEYP